jgi:hypothetical protein
MIKLSPKDKKNEIILFRSDLEFNSMTDVLKEIENKRETGEQEMQDEKLVWKYSMDSEDELVIPKFRFNIETNYSSLEGSTFHSGIMKYIIEIAWQRTAFILDESGTEIESEASMEVTASAEEEIPEEKPRPKKMRFDKPFFLMLKKTDRVNPYFGMWVANSELMISELDN